MGVGEVKKIFKEGLSVNALKYIAITAMLIDHIDIAFIPEDMTVYLVFDIIGRITGPIMFFCAVEGYHHTKSLKKYIFRLFIFAIISYIPFMYAWRDTFNILRLNIIFNILLGVLAVHTRRTVKNVFLKAIIIYLLMIISIPADYGELCIIIMLVFDFYYGNLKNQLAGYFLVIVLNLGLLDFFAGPFWNLVYDGNFKFYNDYYWIGYLLPFMMLLFYNGKHGSSDKFSKWIFYIFYPLHLCIIWIVRVFILNI
ncbi:hypothetical protein HMPREF9629_00076 [Peptoanaerobacter stomatis]|uniref:Protein TraX n=1 Tax=Peptoanaerobacter stomatis TaxID=796937 RepID=G9WXI7_9FIRM|nr:TraX family protein [Peptoanaerobacter stomatis]EHL16834.1 hypothetical protein HMPREF9629_00076 [Peptoanaerobacter stomatis]